jgi:UDP-4-amino-4,6-dideoxy-N-acetyl-beta-L-altrosamine transaminase
MTFLPYGRQVIDDDDVAAVAAVLKGEYLTSGPATEVFETALSARVGARFSFACSSGTAGLHMATTAAGFGPGDAVIVPSITFLATANAVRMTGAEVIFADVDPDNGLMMVEQLAAAFDCAPPGLFVKGVIPVHLAGQCADMAAIAEFAANKNLIVIEDAAHAIGSSYQMKSGKTAIIGECSHSDMAVFSFHPVKTIAMGEGGAVTTNDSDLARKLSFARNHGMTRDPDLFVHKEMATSGNGVTNPWYYEMPIVGYNYRASDIHCALVNSQLNKLDRFVDIRQRLVDRYDSKLATESHFFKPIKRNPLCSAAWHLYPVLIEFDKLKIDRAMLMEALKARDIGTQVHYIPVSAQPYYVERYGKADLQGAQAYYERTLSLPLHAGMAETDVDRICETFSSVIVGAT